MTEWLGYGYLIVGAITMGLMSLNEYRHTGNRSEALWWLVVWIVGITWPLVLPTVLVELLDGPYQPKHHADKTPLRSRYLSHG